MQAPIRQLPALCIPASKCPRPRWPARIDPSLGLSLSLSPSLSLSLALALALALARCAAIVRFWRFRPLADFYGGPELASAAMRPAHAVRERVARWLDDHDAPTDHGRGGRDSGRSSQLQLDEMACEIEPNPNTLTS